MRLKPLASYVLALSVTAAGVAHADGTDDFIRAELKRQNIPGLSLALIKDGVVIKTAGYGVADLKTKAPATPETVYKIASVSKQFVATGVMLLVQEGRLAIDDAIAKFIPGVPAAWSRITIRHLLTYTAGLVREPPAFNPFTLDADAELIKSAYATPLSFAPGEKWQYSNLGYVILAEIISRVSRQPWSDFMTERVFRPSGMTATRTTTTEPIANKATGYSDNDKLIDAPDWPAVRAGGAFISTVLDLARWDAVLRTGSILTEASRAQMWAPTTLSNGAPSVYGFGWHVNRPGTRRGVWHSGGLPGFKAQYRRYIDEGITVIILMNLDDADDDSIAVGVAERYLQDRK